MQIATLSYQFNPKENVNGDGRAKLRHRRVLTTITNPQKKPKRQSLRSNLNIQSNAPLPPIKSRGQHGDSIRIKGSSLPSSKLGEHSAHSFGYQSRSHSRQSNRSENLDARSRSISPAGTSRPASKLIRLKFGYPIKLRSADFYGPDKSEAELRFREESFVNDSVRSANQNRRLSIIPNYEAFDDPHLRRFFQSPIVLDIVRKTLNTDPNHSYKQDERSSKLFKSKKRSESIELHDNRNDDYQRIVSKGSSGYAKLNGYDCIPSYSPARHYYHHSSTVDPTTSSSQRWNTTESRLNHSTAHDKYQASANSSVTSFPSSDINQLQKQQEKKKTRKHNKSKQLKPIATSSPLRHPVRHLVEGTKSIIELSSPAKTNDNDTEQTNEFAVVSTVSQD